MQSVRLCRWLRNLGATNRCSVVGHNSYLYGILYCEEYSDGITIVQVLSSRASPLEGTQSRDPQLLVTAWHPHGALSTMDVAIGAGQDSKNLHGYHRANQHKGRTMSDVHTFRDGPQVMGARKCRRY